MNTPFSPQNTNGNNKILLLFLFVWLIVNFIQAAFTGLINDEAYYWVYSQNLDWGYFDHPPGIAVFIKTGTLLLGGEAGVRLLVVLSSVASVFLMWKITENYSKNIPLFFILIFSVVLVHVGGFIAVPDTPLIFFASLFLYFYRKYLENDKWTYAIILAVLCAAMLYSKYHGILIIFFTIISNFHLFKRKSFYLIFILSIAFFLPHIIWQFQNELPSIRFHLSDRSRDPYNFEHTIGYILGQLLITGPLIGGFLFYAAFKQKAEDQFLKTLKFVFWGIILFFLFSTIKGKVEPNWTAVAFIPLVVLSTIYASGHTKFQNIIRKLAVPGILLIVVVRIFAGSDFIAQNFKLKTEVHFWKEWAEQIKSKADGAPVVFMNSYQRASKYSFYTGEKSYSLNNVSYRSNQYNLWSDLEIYFQGKDVFFVPVYEAPYSEPIETTQGILYGGLLRNYHSYDFIQCRTIEKSYQGNAGEEIKLSVIINNSAKYKAEFAANEEFLVHLNYTIEKEDKVVFSEKKEILKVKELSPGDFFEQEILVKIPEEKGRYDLMITLEYGPFPPSLNGEYKPLIVK